MSAIGSSSWWPKSCHADELVGDLVDRGGAELVAGPKVLISSTPWVCAPSECAFGLPR